MSRRKLAAALTTLLLSRVPAATSATPAVLFESTVSPVRGSNTLGQWGLALVETAPNQILAMWEAGDSEPAANAVWSARSSDGGRSWHDRAPFHSRPSGRSTPAGYFRLGDELHALVNELAAGASSVPVAVVERVSSDGGRTWSHPSLWWRQWGGAAMQPVVLRDGEVAIPLYSVATDGAGLTSLATVVVPASDTGEPRRWLAGGAGADTERPCLGEVGWISSATPRGALEPALVECASGTWMVLVRTEGTGRLLAAFSNDRGRSWESLSALPLASPSAIARSLTLKNGAVVVVWNDVASTLAGPRNRLSVTRSRDCGETWSEPALLRSARSGVFSNHGLVERHDGVVLVAYQDLHRWDPRTRPRGADSVELVAFDPERLP